MAKVGGGELMRAVSMRLEDTWSTSRTRGGKAGRRWTTTKIIRVEDDFVPRDG
jgi:hypothetical protein